MPSEVVPSLSVAVFNGDPVDNAEQAIITQRDKAQEQVDRLNAALEVLRKLRANGHQAVMPVQEGEYKGKRAIDALEIYLRARRGVKISIAQAVGDLVKGGAYPGQPRKGQADIAGLMAHTLKIGIPQKPRLFDFEPTVPAKNKKMFKFPRKTANSECFVWLGAGADLPKIRKRTNFS